MHKQLMMLRQIKDQAVADIQGITADTTLKMSKMN